jgi:hypothetical protein
MKKINQLAAANKMIKALRKGIGRFRLPPTTVRAHTTHLLRPPYTPIVTTAEWGYDDV